ncbi:MAG TPA: redoxin family protein [Chitinophagaceae bacterium]|nr:redoxin family protein [Chitinophagaceae bacterium]
MHRPSSQLKFFYYSALLFSIPIIFGCSASKVAISSPSANISYNVTSGGISGNWGELGFQKGDRVPDFTLYDTDGKQFDLSSELKLRKPVVLITASYTCDVSRYNIPAIKSISSKYKNEFNFFMVYLIEPHPADAPSPYSADGKIWLATANIRDHVEANQPKTYQQRVDISKKWKQTYNINLPVLIDNPKNIFWSDFGEAPNMAYVILPNRTVYYKQPWFNQPLLDQELQALAGNH